MGDQLFPHLHGGIPPVGVVHKELAVERAPDGTFIAIDGLFEGAESSPPTSESKTEAPAKPKSMSFLGCALILGLAVGTAITAGMFIKRSSTGKFMK